MPVQFDILTLFPKMFEGPFNESLLKKAQEKGLIEIRTRSLRDFTADKHKQVDDKQFGGGAGMVLKVEPLFQALQELSVSSAPKKPWVIYLSPQGKTLTQKKALELSRKNHMILLCGHYEGIDERAMEWVDEEISIGDYVLTGGELPAMVLIDTVSRLIPGVVKEQESIENDSFFKPALDHSHYTRPSEFLGRQVPEVLLSGNHREIADWRKQSSFSNTTKKRPELLSPEFLSGVPLS
ncbi:MAG: tRNA (guanosine(37)-N1)-methyltransferase TrmD [Elusimicrobia bacterium]|nr:tRNA (guanosine(37)-N1)-methyltransferase TrmD [Elusimicrobiota bacterium]